MGGPRGVRRIRRAPQAGFFQTRGVAPASRRRKQLRSAGRANMTSGTWHKTACYLCYVSFGIEGLVNDGHIEKVRGAWASRQSKEELCNMASRFPFYAHHKDRVTPPLRRRADGGFDAISG